MIHTDLIRRQLMEHYYTPSRTLIEELLCEIDTLRAFQSSIRDKIQGKSQREIKVDVKYMNHLQTSLAPITLKSLRHLFKADIMAIMLTREAYMYQKIEEFNRDVKETTKREFRKALKNIQELMEDIAERDIKINSLHKKVKRLTEAENGSTRI